MADFPVGGGSVGALMRAHDWSRSPLGPPDSWPNSLRTVVDLMLQSQFPMFVAWGDALGFLYNDPYAEILGTKHPRALGSRFHDIWAEIWTDISPLIDAALSGKSTYSEDLPLVMNRKGYDEHTWFTFSYSPIRDDDGRIAGMFCAVHETTRRVLAERALRELNDTLERRVTEAVTERMRDQERLRHAEQVMRQAQRLESLGQLTGGVAHDFNNLLAVFASGVQVLERNPTERQRENILDAMRRAVARGTGLTRHLLAFSRRRPVNPESIDLSAHLATMQEMLASSLRGDIRIEMSFDPGLWPVEIDAGELELAVVNLCVNARDAMPAGGTITIAARNVEQPGRDGKPLQMVQLSVADTGVGIPPEIMARVFDPFFTTKDVGKGSGLGLAQVYGFAQQSGGRVSITSEVGVGTVVTLLLPRSPHPPVRVQKPDEPRVVPAASPGAIRRGTVLLVEDDKEVAALAREMLAAIGFGVVHVSDAVAALGALADGRRIDAVFSDIMMPGGISGVDLAREVRRRHPAMPIVLATGYVESAAGVKDGEFSLLLKPYSLEALASALGV
jgi:signal transduction histidine kinase/CheY-like chemotaxis protein